MNNPFTVIWLSAANDTLELSTLCSEYDLLTSSSEKHLQNQIHQRHCFCRVLQSLSINLGSQLTAANSNCRSIFTHPSRGHSPAYTSQPWAASCNYCSVQCLPLKHQTSSLDTSQLKLDASLVVFILFCWCVTTTNHILTSQEPDTSSADKITCHK